MAFSLATPHIIPKGCDVNNAETFSPNGEARGGRGASGRLLEELRGIGRKCAFYNGFAGSVPKIGAALTMGYCQIAFDFDIICVEKKYALFLNDWHGKRVGKELD